MGGVCPATDFVPGMVASSPQAVTHMARTRTAGAVERVRMDPLPRAVAEVVNRIAADADRVTPSRPVDSREVACLRLARLDDRRPSSHATHPR